MYSLSIAYLLWLLSGFGALGFHRFYLGKIPTGLLWMFTGGLAMFGSVYDFLTLPGQVREANYRNALLNQAYRRNKQPANGNWRYATDAEARVVGSHEKKDHPERVILKLAKENKGILTVSDVALGADIPIEEAKKMLETLVSKGFAELRVRKSGSLVYVITDMADKDEPLEDF
jgi:TM2 domain-containing membrane protein YozV/predicted transcriptional regulator